MELNEYSNPEVRENKRQYKVASDELRTLKDVFTSIKTLQDELKKCGADLSPEAIKIRNIASTRIGALEKKRKKLYSEYWDVLIKNCEHDFKYDGESYGGNYDIYVCTKCGMVKHKK